MVRKNLLIINDVSDIKYLNPYQIKSFEILTLSPNTYLNLKKKNIGKIILKPNHFFYEKYHKHIVNKKKFI